MSVGAIGPTRVNDKMLGTRNKTKHLKNSGASALNLHLCLALLSAADVPVPHRSPNSVLYGTTAAALQGLPFLGGSHERCLSVCACVRLFCVPS